MNTDPILEWTNPPGLASETYTFVRFVKTGSADTLKWHFSKIQCNHCIDPFCVNGCPSKALVKTSDGPVVYRKDLCIGCKYCTQSCPFGVPQWDEINSVIEKCTFCSERLSEGLEPACVQACPTSTLKLMDLNEARSIAQGAEKSGLYTYGLNEVGGTSWIYISDTNFKSLGFPSRSTSPPVKQHTDILTNFAGIGVIGGAVLLGLKAYSDRVKKVVNEKEEN
jgi:formate dehydrogenase iron-sulfur subunit